MATASRVAAKTAKALEALQQQVTEQGKAISKQTVMIETLAARVEALTQVLAVKASKATKGSK